MTEPTTEPMVHVHVAFRAPAMRKAEAIALAQRRGLTLSGLVNVLLGREVEADRASRLSIEVSAPVLGAARNITTRTLTGRCLHPIHMREQWGLQKRCGGCGAYLGKGA